MVTKYSVMSDFGGQGIIPLMKSIITAVPPFFSIVLFMVWIFGTASSYFAILKITGKKRFWHSLTAMSFATFLLSLLIAAMNEASFVFLSGYWVGFYILMTLASFFLLDRYK
jgi:hypothetical protein